MLDLHSVRGSGGSLPVNFFENLCFIVHFCAIWEHNDYYNSKPQFTCKGVDFTPSLDLTLLQVQVCCDNSSPAAT